MAPTYWNDSNDAKLRKKGGLAGNVSSPRQSQGGSFSSPRIMKSRSTATSKGGMGENQSVNTDDELDEDVPQTPSKKVEEEIMETPSKKVKEEIMETPSKVEMPSMRVKREYIDLEDEEEHCRAKRVTIANLACNVLDALSECVCHHLRLAGSSNPDISVGTSANVEQVRVSIWLMLDCLLTLISFWDGLELLAAIIETAPSINYKQVADILGNGLTANAVQHRIRKIRAKAAGAESGPTTPTATPKKNASTTPRTAIGLKREASSDESEMVMKREKDDAKKMKGENHDVADADDEAMNGHVKRDDEVHVKAEQLDNSDAGK
ncbi:hypothetical protein KEM54_006945 [Ascosphaera aggregata]|nr:hypothetical protein KEM54_006945 [Ascosphaera aggregata]